MSTILTDTSPENMTIAIEENLAAWIPVFGKMGFYNQSKGAHLKRSITNIQSGLFNSIMDARLEPEQAQATIQAILTDATRRKIPLLWWTGPTTRPVDLGDRLVAHGFQLEDDGSGMAVDLTDLDESLPTPAGFSIQLAQGEAAFEHWVRVMFTGFEVPDDSATASRAAWLQLLKITDPDKVMVYTGWLEDQAVACSLLFLEAGVAGLYAVATVPAARRKGVGGMMTLHPLLHARSLGFRAGILQASEMGKGVYSSVGFKDYCQIRSYRWKPVDKAKAE